MEEDFLFGRKRPPDREEDVDGRLLLSSLAPPYVRLFEDCPRSGVRSVFGSASSSELSPVNRSRDFVEGRFLSPPGLVFDER